MAKAKPVNELRCAFPSWSANEALARSVAASFAAQLNPTCEEVSDLKCAVSEAVTNAIVHGYRDSAGEIQMILKIYDEVTSERSKAEAAKLIKKAFGQKKASRKKMD